ncbi:hypothetical protein [Streptomyces sp. NBC_00986]|nr:hypothetical protein OG504_29590 [Streptomyces sp. NBC_00986]
MTRSTPPPAPSARRPPPALSPALPAHALKANTEEPGDTGTANNLVVRF